jgi:hypothetical protein
VGSETPTLEQLAKLECDESICEVAAATHNEALGGSTVRTYCLEPKRGRRNWKDKAEHANRRLD